VRLRRHWNLASKVITNSRKELILFGMSSFLFYKDI